MSLKQLFFFILISFLSVGNGFAQEKGQPIPLKQVLDEISKQHQVTFNYIEEEITLFQLNAPKKDLSLTEKLDYISQKTKLQFEFISDKYISVVNDKNLDKPLCGFLLDLESNEAIPFATLHILNKNIFLTTDKNGYFALDKKENYTIEVSHISYQNFTFSSVDLYKKDCLKIYLKPTIQNLNPIEIEFLLTKGILKKIDGSIEITPKKMGLLPGLTEPDAFLTLQQIPGINSVDENVDNTNVRGGTHDQNLFVWNGIKLFHTGHFFGLISTLNPNLAHKISLYKNGTPAQYGNGISSTVLISTHTDNIEETSGAIGFNFINSDFYSKVKLTKNANLEISGRRSYTDMFASPTYNNFYNKIFQNTVVTNYNNSTDVRYSTSENFYFYDFTTQYHQKIKEKTHLFVDIIGISNILDLHQTQHEDFFTISKNSFLKQHTLGGSILLKSDWNTKNQFLAQIQGSYYDIKSENEALESQQTFNQENTILDAEMRLHNTTKLTPKFSIKNGYQFNEIGIRNVDKVNTPSFSRKVKNVITEHALFSELNYKSENRTLNGRIGLRGSYIQEFSQTIVEPRINLNYGITPHLNLELQAETKHQIYSQIIDLQQDFLGIEKRRWTLANNQNIPVLKSRQIALGATFKKNNWLFSVDNFYKKINGITTQSQGFQNQFEFVKTTGNYTVLGSELLLQKQWKNWTSWVSYSVMKNDYEFNTLQPNHFPNNYEINHHLKSAIITSISNVKLSLGAIWFTGKPNTLLASNTPVYNSPQIPEIVYQNPNNANLKNYFQVNFSSGYEIKTGKKSKLNFGIAVLNILDTKSFINQHYRIDTISQTIEEVNTYSLERTFNGFVRFSLLP